VAYPLQNKLKFYEKCSQNMTFSNYKEEKRCAAAIAWQQWGLKFDAKDIVGLEAAVKEQLGAELSGVGIFTLDGVIAQGEGKKTRLWCEELMVLNQTYNIPCIGDKCGQCGEGVGPLPPPGPGPCPGPAPVTPTPAPGPAPGPTAARSTPATPPTSSATPSATPTARPRTSARPSATTFKPVRAIERITSKRTQPPDPEPQTALI
jgi:hypothetical protein